MYLVEEHYYTINKAFLKVLGIWHQDRSCLVLLQRILIIILLLTYISIQLAVFITTKCDMALFMKNISFVMLYMLITLTYFTFILKSENITQLYHRIGDNWKIIRSRPESEILWKHIQQCHIYIILMSLLTGLVLVVGIAMQYLPILLDILTPLDESRPRKIIIPVEYFVLQDKYFYTKALHENVIFSICVTIFLATSMQLLIFIYHCFGMFKIASYRVEHSIDDNLLRMSACEQKRVFCKRVMHAVIAHRKAMEISNAMIATFNVPFCILIILGILSLSINLYRFVDAAAVSKDIEDIIISGFIILVHIIFMFVNTFLGQMIIDSNQEIFVSLYAISWYLLPVSSQKLLLVLLQKAGKDFSLVIGVLFTSNVESFAMLLNTALSYVMVMLSV